jgi:glutaredoxin 3
MAGAPEAGRAASTPMRATPSPSRRRPPSRPRGVALLGLCLTAWVAAFAFATGCGSASRAPHRAPPSGGVALRAPEPSPPGEAEALDEPVEGDDSVEAGVSTEVDDVDGDEPASDAPRSVTPARDERAPAMPRRLPGTAPVPDRSASRASGGTQYRSVSATIYGAAWCGPCHSAEKLLRSKGVQVSVKDIETDLQARREVRDKLERAGRTKNNKIPVIDINGQLLVGYSRRAIEEALEASRRGFGF